jgi:hypothetical protein
MHTFIGDLLIGGMTLSHVEGELESESHANNSHDWILSGRIGVSSKDIEFLELGRQYRLELEDGRASQVVLSRLEPVDEEHFVAEFEPKDLSDPEYSSSGR